MKNKVIRIIIIVLTLFTIGILYKSFTKDSELIAKGTIIEIISVYVYEVNDVYSIGQNVEVFYTGMIDASNPPGVDVKKVKIK